MIEADHHPKTPSLVRKLRSIADLSPHDLQALSEIPMSVESHPAYHDLIREGDNVADCHLILDGFACRYKSLPGGLRQILSFHTPGDIVDLQGLQLKTMDYGVSTLVPTVVGRVSHATLYDLTLRHPGIARAFWRDTLIDAAIFGEWMLGLGRRSAREHLAHLLCEMTLRFEATGRPAGEMPLSRTALADALGLTTVQVNRELQGLGRDGLIEPRTAAVEVLNFEGLARVCRFDPGYLHQDCGR